MLGALALLVIIGLQGEFAFEELLTTAIAVAVAAIPESLVVAVTVIFAIGIASDILLLGILYRLLTFSSYTIEEVRTVIFVALAFNSLLVIFSLKSLRRSLPLTDLFNNLPLAGAIGIGILMLVLAIYVPFLQDILKLAPLGPFHWVLVVSVAFIQLLLIEVVKIFFRKEEKTY